jgi:hypothetical protein
MDTEKWKNKKIKYTCHTCHWPIYEGEEVWKSNTGKSTRSGTSTTYHGSRRAGYKGGWGGGVSRRYSSGTTDCKSFSWIQCGWCITEFKKDRQRYNDWVNNFLSKGYKWYFILGGLLLGIIAAVLIYFFVGKKLSSQGTITLLIYPIVALIGLGLGVSIWEKFWNWHHDKNSPHYDRYQERERERGPMDEMKGGKNR